MALVTLLAIFAGLAFATTANAKDLKVPDEYPTIQAAVDAAEDGDTVKVEGGTYVESVTVTKSIKLKGSQGATIMAPAIAAVDATDPRYEYLVALVSATGISAELKGFTLDANNYYPASRWTTVLMRNVNGENGKSKVEKNELINILIDGKETFGILGYENMDVKIKKNLIDGFARGGIGMYGGKAKIEDNVVNGPGEGPVTWAPNGIQVGYGASGEIKKNEVSGCGWPGPQWSGTAILVVDTSDVKVKDNYVYSNEQAIGVVDFPGDLYGPVFDGVVSDIEVNGNVIDDNSWGLAISNDVSNIEVERNEITNSMYDGIDVYNYSGTAAPAPSNVNINCNLIAGNGLDGMWVGPAVTQTVDAEDNYWGAADGPSGDGPGSGDTVIGNADYDPWLDKDKLCKGKK